MYETSYVDDRTGRTVTAPLPSPRIRPGAVPSKFPACSSYFSKESTSRESADSKRKRLEAAALQAAIAESTETSLREQEADRIACVGDLACHLRNQDSTFWHIIENEERLVIFHIVEDEAPWMKYSLVLKADMGTTFHFMKKPTTTLGRDLCVPATADSKRAVMEFLDGVQAWDANTDSPLKLNTAVHGLKKSITQNKKRHRFASCTLMYETSYVDDRTGRTVTAPLPSPRMSWCVPSKFPIIFFKREHEQRKRGLEAKAA
ncbi:hypothetical protein HPB48_000063 [Haemaphysalis longicornis]|uniref:Uncharacterized protein n=1 Tax=Haemaphysalis longicornis TaxID=44386 RepID=A0A9J6GUH8_HAELO|nr:hypothetical protein HPB48_000063 [Haemaphysalis longicornis]